MTRRALLQSTLLQRAALKQRRPKPVFLFSGQQSSGMLGSGAEDRVVLIRRQRAVEGEECY